MTSTANRQSHLWQCMVWWAHQSAREIDLPAIIGEGFTRPFELIKDSVTIGDTTFPTARLYPANDSAGPHFH